MTQPKTRAALRTFWRRLHATLGLVCAVVFTIVCATGALYLFRDEIARVVEPERYYVDRDVAKTAERIDLDDLVENLEHEMNAQVETVVVPRDRRRTVRFLLKGAGARNRRILCDVDPYSGKVVGLGADKAAPFFMSVRRWHTRLNMDRRIGRPIVDVCCGAMIVMLVSGIRLWLPKTKKLIKQRFTIKWNGSRERVLFDLHNAVGVYTLFPLLILSITGTIFSFNEIHADLAPRTKLEARNEPDAQVAPLWKMLQTCDEVYGEGELKITLPTDLRKETVRIERASGSFGAFVVPTVIYWDAVEGKIVGARAYRDLDAKNKRNAIIRGCHYGDVFGSLSKLVFAFGCLGGVILSVTGYLLTLFRSARSKKGSN